MDTLWGNDELGSGTLLLIQGLTRIRHWARNVRLGRGIPDQGIVSNICDTLSTVAPKEEITRGSRIVFDGSRARVLLGEEAAERGETGDNDRYQGKIPVY